LARKKVFRGGTGGAYLDRRASGGVSAEAEKNWDLLRPKFFFPGERERVRG